MICMAIIVILVLVIVVQNIKINKISSNLEEVIKGNFNERVRLNVNSKAVKNLIINLNRLIDEFQKIVLLNKEYEEDRKKMISNISHDIRTPLTSILGYIEMIKTDDTLTEQERMEYLDVTIAKGELLRQLIEDFFNLSKLEADDIALNKRKINITEIVRVIILSFIKDFENNEIKLEIDIPDKDILINADEKCIHRIVQNLISNALKYGQSGKVIGVMLKDDSDKVIMEVWDKGKGIPKEEIPYIFKRLYTVDKSRNNKLRGNGLGLTIVKKLVEMHNGKIEVDSIPNGKTSFKVTFPKS